LALAAKPVDADLSVLGRYQRDWCAFAREVLMVSLDPEQEKILRSVQKNPRTIVRSGHARGKDFVAAVAMLCFLYLCYPSKVFGTAPTFRQCTSIMMSEVATLWRNANAGLRNAGLPGLGGRLLSEGIKFDADPNWFLEVFKAGENSQESWTGLHAPHVLFVVTEASGLADKIYNDIEGNLTGVRTRLLMVGNPNQTDGTFYESFYDKRYSQFALSCLDAPNVVAKKILIPGQVNYEWVDDKVGAPGWTIAISPEMVDPEKRDFKWNGKWYRPTDLFLIKVLGEFAIEGDDSLIPRAWVEAAELRWVEAMKNGTLPKMCEKEPLKLGVDVAGMGVDSTVLCRRYGDVVKDLVVYGRKDPMQVAASVLMVLSEERGTGFIDTIGEGAGVFSRLKELKQDVISAKFSYAARNNRKELLTDRTGERSFWNMRAYCYWAARDWLDPTYNSKAMLPPCQELKQDLCAHRWKTRKADGRILIREKDEVKDVLGRSPDFSDSFVSTFFPKLTAGAFVGRPFNVIP